MSAYNNVFKLIFNISKDGGMAHKYRQNHWNELNLKHWHCYSTWWKGKWEIFNYLSTGWSLQSFDILLWWNLQSRYGTE